MSGRIQRAIVGVVISAPLLFAQGVVEIPSNLRAEGIPPIPVSLMETLARYADARTATLQDWHPTKREMLISTRFGDVPQIHHVAMPGGARTQLTFYPDRVSGAKYRPGSGDAFVFSKDVGGGEFFQLYLYEVSTGRVTLLTDGKSRNGSAQWSPDGRRLVHSSTRRNGRDTDLYLADPGDPKATRPLLEVVGGGWGASDWSGDSRTVLVSHYLSVNERALYLVDAATGKKDRLTPETPKAAYDNAQFSKDGKGVYLTTDRDSEFHRIARLDLATRKLAFLGPALEWNAGGLELSADGRRLAYTVNEDGSETLHVLDLQTHQEIPLPKLPAGTIGALRWHSNNRDLGFSLSSARNPGDAYSIEVEKRTVDRWTSSETGGLNPEAFSEPSLIRWKSFDGRMISGFLYRPARRFAAPWPVIVSIHGGPEGQSRAGFLGRNNHFLDELGVALIYPNVRGSTGYGKTFQNLDNGVRREDSVKDIGALLDWIGGQKDLDAGRVMVTGGSYGGYMTLASMFHFNDRLRCGLDVVGISNFNTMLARTGAYRQDLRRVEYGDERDPGMRDFFETTAPLNNAHRITKPMFIVQGGNDPRVPMRESEQMVAAIRKNGGPVWYLLAGDEGHGFTKKKNQEVQFAATALFVQQHLLSTPLFNGRDLEGWEADTPGLWQVRDGVIVGKHNGLKYNDFLRTRKHYSDFRLELSFRLVGGVGNSGIQFRSKPVAGSHEVSGYQADIGEKYWGSLYDESRRNKVLAQAPPESLATLKPDGWNRYVITARGNHITLEVNGARTVDYRENDPGIDTTGFLALQVHSGPPIEVHFKDLLIRELKD